MPDARKRFAQHFLADTAIGERIVRAFMAETLTDACVEIGPGRGALTQHLLRHTRKLTAIELDRDLAARLRRQFAHKSLHVIEDDVLRVDFAQLREQLGGKLRLIGNLPYNISTPLLFHLIAHKDSIADMIFMLQREVAKRILAKPGQRQWGRLALSTQRALHCEHLFDAPPEAFSPRPKVFSSVLKLRVRDDAQAVDERAWQCVVTAAFSQRRKTLRNALAQILDETQIEACGVRASKRAGEVTPAEFAALAAALGDSARAHCL